MSDAEQIEIQIAEAFGRLAARNGKSVRECPYEANGYRRQRMLSARFVHAYFEAGGTSPIGDDDPGDDDGPVSGPNGRPSLPIVAAAVVGGAAAAAIAHRIAAKGQQ